MVTFAAATKNYPSFPTRAPAQRRVDHFVAITCSDPNDSHDLSTADCQTVAQLVSPSRDPIGFDGNAIGLYGYCLGRSLSAGDPTGNFIICWTQNGYGGLGPFGGGGYLLCKDDCKCPGGKRNVAIVFCGGLGVGAGLTVTAAGVVVGPGCLSGGWSNSITVTVAAGVVSVGGSVPLNPANGPTVGGGVGPGTPTGGFTFDLCYTFLDVMF